MDAEAATYWLGWVRFGQLIAIFLVAVGVAAEFAGEWISRPLEGVVDHARELQLAQLTTDGVKAKAEIAKATADAARADERSKELDLALQKEKEKTSARPWTQEQFDAIQSMKGQIPAVAILGQKDCIECQLLANHLVTAFHEAGAEIYFDASLDMGRGTGIFVFLPPGSDLNTHPVVLALGKANLPAGSTHLDERYSQQLGIRIDIPIVQVGERFPPHLQFPYFPNSTGSFSLHPLKK